MPYIKPERRQGLRPKTKMPAETEGELDFQITCLLDDYMTVHGVSYDRMGDCTSACENAAAEFRRRIMAPYEQAKQLENGDVYSRSLTDKLYAELQEQTVKILEQERGYH